MGYDHGYDAEEVFYQGLALVERYVEGFVEGCPERIGEHDPDEAGFLRGCGAAQGGRGRVARATRSFIPKEGVRRDGWGRGRNALDNRRKRIDSRGVFCTPFA